MSQNLGWFKRQRAGLWHLRKGGIEGYRQWQDRHTKSISSEPARERKVVPVTVDDVSVPVIAGIASMPSRTRLLRDAFNSIYWQVDRVYVFLNNFEEVPNFLKMPRVKIFRSQDYEDYKDVGKFFALTEIDEGILFTIDDDILYPPDYVSRMLTYLASTNYNAAIGVHGFQLPNMPKSFFDRHMFHFRHELKSLAFASVLGTGTAAFDIKRVGIKFQDFTSFGMADIHFAAHLKNEQIPAVVIPREKEWLIPLSSEDESEESPSLYELTQRNAAPHGIILRSVAPWGEDYICDSWPSNREFPVSSNLRIALDAIISNRKLEFGEVDKSIAQLETNDVREVLNWIAIYADYSSQSALFERLLETLEQPALIRECINHIWRIDASRGFELSEKLLSNRSNDFQSLRFHANLSSGYFMPDEAESHYLRAIRIAGAMGNKGTPSILFDLLKLFMRYGEYGKASVVASSLQKTHWKYPYFQAAMFLCAINDERLETAKEWISTLLASADEKRRDAAVDFLVRTLAEASINRIPAEHSVISPELIVELSDSYEMLLAILKIATMLGDGNAAGIAFKQLVTAHGTYLERSPEIRDYFATNWETSAPSILDDYVAHRSVVDSGSTQEAYDDGPLISVVLTAYNSQATIGFAIESILNQTHSNLELIVVDDKSQDETIAVIERYIRQDSRVSLIKNSENLGPYESRNQAIESAQGEFLAIQDADDVSVPQRLEWQLEKMTEHVQGVLGQHVRVDAAGKIHLENDGSILGHGPVTLFVRRDLFEKIGAFAPVRTRGDKEFESRIEHRFGSHALVRSEMCVVYALEDRRSNSWTQTSTFEKRRDLMLFKQKYSRLHSKGEFSPVGMD